MKQTNQYKEHRNEIIKKSFDIKMILPWKLTRQQTNTQERPINNELDKN
jgi:hypothetical protein